MFSLSTQSSVSILIVSLILTSFPPVTGVPPLNPLNWSTFIDESTQGREDTSSLSSIPESIFSKAVAEISDKTKLFMETFWELLTVAAILFRAIVKMSLETVSSLEEEISSLVTEEFRLSDMSFPTVEKFFKGDWKYGLGEMMGNAAGGQSVPYKVPYLVFKGDQDNQIRKTKIKKAAKRLKDVGIGRNSIKGKRGV